jgi:hypothetical protein
MPAIPGGLPLKAQTTRAGLVFQTWRRSSNISGRKQSKDRYLVNVIGGDHNSIIYSTESHKTLMTIFFGYYLKGQEEYAQNLTEDYVNTLPGLSWGIYQP